MMRNPVRRSRNIGKTQGGRVKDGRAYEKWSRVFTQDVWTKLSESGDKWQLLRENPSRDFYHPCKGPEYIDVLQRLPMELTNNLRAIVLRRTPKLDAKLGVDARKRYFCVILNSFPKSGEMIWSKPPTDRVRRHYEPWCKNWIENNNKWILRWDVEETRRYYLYHLFLHELGHINQPWFNSVRRREEFAEDFALSWARKLGKL